jgi:hypothetical protein
MERSRSSASELVRGGRDQAAHLVEGLGPAAPGRRARDPQDPHGLDISVPGLGRSGGVAPLGGPGGGHGVFGVGLSLAPPALAVGTVDLDDGDLVGKQVPGQPGPVAAGPFDADELEGPEGLQPAEQGPIARRCGREALHAEQGSSFVEGGRHVHVEVRVDPSGDAARDSGHRHLFPFAWGG